MNWKKFCLFILLIAIPSLLSNSAGAQAKTGELRRHDPDNLKAYKSRIHSINPYHLQSNAYNRWTERGDARQGENSVNSIASMGGPDEYGYTWDDNAPLNWIDASGGVDTGISEDDYTGPIDIDFPFKYYENTYTQLYISKYGFISFNDAYLDNDQSEIPSYQPPNDVIAPNWVPVIGVSGYIRYLTGGISPDRWMVVEWNRLESDGNEYTFEAILHENGDIVFQYGKMIQSDLGWWCASSGIENSTGQYGLTITDFCQWIEGDHAVQIYRPAPQAWVEIFPSSQGQFSQPGAVNSFEIAVSNGGEFGVDTFDISLASSWQTTLLAADGITPLVDTDSDGLIDTGPIPQGTSLQTVARIQAPSQGGPGDDSTATLTFISSLDDSRSKTIYLQTGIPAPFVHAFADEEPGAVYLTLVRTEAQKEKKITADDFYAEEPAVVEAPDGNIFTVWSEYIPNDDNDIYIYEIHYNQVNRYGEPLRPETRLTNHQAAVISVVDLPPVIATAPDGHLGVLWIRELYDPSVEKYNTNVFFAILDSTGKPVYGPVNLTMDDNWYNYYFGDSIDFLSPTITATEDDRFFLAWNKSTFLEDCQCNDFFLDDIYFSIYSTSGTSVKPITQFTFDTIGDDPEGYFYPDLVALQANRAMITWVRESDLDVYFAVLDSAGAVEKDYTNLTNDSEWNFDADSTQLSDGKIAVAWSQWTGSKAITQFAILTSNFEISAGPISLNNPASDSKDGEAWLSLAADREGRAVITSAGFSYVNRFFYSLVDSAGNVLTQPMIYNARSSTESGMRISYLGYSTTTYHSLIEPGIDTLLLMPNQLHGSVPGGAAVVDVQMTNHGGTPAATSTLTLILTPGLIYMGDNSELSPSVGINMVRWDLPEMKLFSEIRFNVILQVTDAAAIGKRYPLLMNLSSPGDVNPEDNLYFGEVMAATQLFIPMMMK
jgi:hypothetical protein